MALLILAGFFLRRRSFANPDYQILLLIVLLLALIPFVVVTKVFGHLDMLALYFHLEFGMGGATLEGMELEIATSVVATVLLFLAVWMLRSALHSRWLVPTACIGLILVNPAVRYFGKAIAYSASSENSLVSDIAVPKYSPDASAELPDLFFIYLEGLERGYGRQESFGDVYAPLHKLAERGIEFREVKQFPATGNSIAGNVATQCGLPLLPNGFRAGNAFREQTDFLGNSICLGDVLSDKGYRLSFAMGSDMEFAGFDHFYSTHQFDEMAGSPAIQAQFPAQEVELARASWGPDDQMLFDFGLKQFIEKSGDQPVAIFLETMGPHGKSSHLSRACTSDGKTITVRSPVPAVECTATLTQEFVERIEAVSPERSKLFVLVSDHLAHHSDATRLLEQEPRRNTFIVFGEGIEPSQKVDKVGSLVDVYPTVLQLLKIGRPPHRGGLGVSLLTDAPSYMETYTYDALHWMLSNDVELARALWTAEK